MSVEEEWMFFSHRIRKYIVERGRWERGRWEMGGEGRGEEGREGERRGGKGGVW